MPGTKISVFEASARLREVAATFNAGQGKETRNLVLTIALYCTRETGVRRPTQFDRCYA